ncbi:MAG: hypothetical protein A2020_03910 [Lentisphaerae bacterium GWF2_45_14]|nr:MAG: hypothetical protein A2020_03910 [Lentisphaerae bacterium GWF2_45_14]
MKKKSCLRNCFSLVELLSVTCIAIAIIALLFPALERAKGMARKTFCKGNLQQMVVCTNLYKADNRGTLPYSSVWLVDFSFLSNYITNFDMAVCPDTEDSVVAASDLVGNTSYHYMGSRYDWEKNFTASGDGSEYGFDTGNAEVASLLSSKEEKVVYDRSDILHYGMFNVVHLDGGHVESLAAANYSNFWYYDDSGSLDSTSDRTRNTNRHRYRHGNTYAEGSGNGYGDTESDAGSEQTNNGHGNNEDGVDCSNPGQGNGGPNGEEDPSGTVDDENGNGSNSSAETSDASTGDDDSSAETSDDDGEGNSNNGHGNNEDGVDCSNPGQGNGGPNGEVDASGDVDDESSNGNNGNGNDKDK